MTQVLLIVLGVYLSACYAYGMYVLYRVAKTRTRHRPTSRLDATDLVRAARAELPDQGAVHEEEETRVAA